jgi:hypothetical protein
MKHQLLTEEGDLVTGPRGNLTGWTRPRAGGCAGIEQEGLTGGENDAARDPPTAEIVEDFVGGDQGSGRHLTADLA